MLQMPGPGIDSQTIASSATPAPRTSSLSAAEREMLHVQVRIASQNFNAQRAMMNIFYDVFKSQYRGTVPCLATL